MAQKRIKRTDQEWFELTKDCKTSRMKNGWNGRLSYKAWLRQD